MIVNIVTAENSKHYSELIWIEITTTAGNFIILPGHAPIIAMLIADKPIILQQKDEKVEIIQLQRPAILEFINDQATIII